jgi:hypothetical protein
MAAMELDRGFSDRTGEYIVTFHAIELGLKAFLIKCGVPEWGLREKPYGHDLVCLYDMAKHRHSETELVLQACYPTRDAARVLVKFGSRLGHAHDLTDVLLGA